MIDCTQVNALWDEYRDGALDAFDAAALEEHLADCAHCETLWRNESEWMNILAEKSPVEASDDTTAFTTSVLAQWHKAQSRPSVLVRLGKLTSIAASIAMVLSLGIAWQLRGQVHEHGLGVTNEPDATVAQVAMPQADPVEAMFHQIDGRASRVRRAIDRSNSFLDVEHYVNPIVSFLDQEHGPGDDAFDSSPVKP